MGVATGPQRQVGVREVKNHLSAYLDRVRHGEEIVITDRGRPVARLTSLQPDADHLHTLIDHGVLIPATARRALPSRRITAKGSLGDLAAAERR